MSVRKYCLLAIAGFFLSCQPKVGEYVGRNYSVKVDRVKDKMPSVAGMVFVPSGSFVMGESKEEDVFQQLTQNKRVSVASFYIDEKEVTNNEYRKFINWVRDSVAVTQFMEKPERYYLKPMKGSEKDAPKELNWRLLGINNTIFSKGSKKLNPRLEEMFYESNGLFNKKGDLKTGLLKYRYEIFDYNEALKHKNDPLKNRSDFTYVDTVDVYPDTTVWLTDFNNAGNKLLVESYFSDPSMGDYPVVGITWRQARAYAAWKTMYVNRFNNRGKVARRKVEIRLPTEAEFEYAARGGLVDKEYPWGNDLYNNCNCLMANFRSAPGNYVADGGIYTRASKSYYKNGYGLLNMAGNVAEWTLNSYSTSKLAVYSDLNPNYNYYPKPFDSPETRRKVVKGGSWKDAPYFIRNSARSFEDQDVPRSYIGFRTVMSASLSEAINRK